MASTSSIGNASLANASSAQAFYSHFRSSTDVLLSQLSDSVTTQEQLQQAVQTYAGLSAELTQAVDSGILPSHDQGVHKRRLEEISAALEEKRKGLGQRPEGSGVGKKKAGFAFKRKQPAVAAVTQSSPTIAPQALPTTNAIDGTQDGTVPTVQGRQSSHVTISALRGTRYKHSIIFSAIESSKSVSIDVTDISNSIVDLRPLTSTYTILAVQIRSVTNSSLLLPPIEGSIMIHGLTSSLLGVPSCHQFRMHNSKDSVVELSTKRGSVVTLEGCSAIRFVTNPQEPIRVQDFDDLINSEQLRQQDKRQHEANFSVVARSNDNCLADKVESLSNHDSSIGESVNKFLVELLKSE
ncbi:Tubulin binding cofactor C-like domain protein [Kalmanozyma brasiliensis GHG001]|uniref:Tubulin binding cofactor C-like domain protein n=1 Tax=Kalmanozyma brasiliensis (strain GHG001) TaxID=1365824 RepID=UPI002867FBED|nr:Tubulin binding cofactor C-like domain protein [Kalmanozyma brasiliensis GHG001]KAF6767310.1 Tubulin binding cofactor C-like domain protein [Kalmanozyma brasiliensis GHG001]